MKILYVDHTDSNYGSSILYKGLCEVLGHDNVIDYPANGAYHGSPVWPFQPNYPEKAWDGEMDLIVLATPRPHALETLKTLERLPYDRPFVFVDQEDYSSFNWDIYNEYKPLCCFKRSFQDFVEKPDNCYPLPLGCPFEMTDPYRERPIDIYINWNARNNLIRPEIEQLLCMWKLTHPGVNVEVANHPIAWTLYFNELKHTKVCISAPGYDNCYPMRFWEGISAGCCVMQYETPGRLPVPFIHEKEVMYFNLNTMGVRFSHIFYHKDWGKIAQGAQEKVNAHYTSEKIGEYFLRKVRNHFEQ